MELNELNELGGWEHRPDVIERVMGASTSFCGSLYDANPTMKDAGKGKVVLLFQAFKAAVGRDPTYRPQWIGSCVGRTGAMVGDILAAMQASAGLSVWPGCTVAASVYGPARVEIGRGEHGQRIGGEGAVVAYGVEAACKFGLLQAKKYTTARKIYDLTGCHDDDDLCAAWGNSGMPDDLEPIAHALVYKFWASVDSYEEARDAIASGCPVWFGTSQSFWGRTKQRDANGFLRAGGRTAHSWQANGTIDDGKIVGLVLDNRQWGDDWIAGPQGPYPIGEGRFLCSPEDFEALLRSGEAYAVSKYTGLDVPANVVPDFTKW